MVRNTGTVEQTIETEQGSSTSIQMVQLPTHSNIPGVSMVINTGDSEDHWNLCQELHNPLFLEFNLYDASIVYTSFPALRKYCCQKSLQNHPLSGCAHI